MADPAGTKTDGAIQFGSQLVQIGGVNYTLEKGSLKRGSRRILQSNIWGVPWKKAHVKTLAEGSGTLQYPTASAVSPALFVNFTAVPAGGAAPVTLVLEETGEEYDHEGETKCSITFSELLGN